jgi:hypothetical protein
MAQWLGSVPKCEWNAGNSEKNEKHGVAPRHIEEVLALQPAFVGRIV